MNPTPTHGGHRQNSGRPQKEETKLINFRVTKAEYKKAKSINKLSTLFKVWLGTL